MNAKACKRLRKLALEIAILNGFPEHRYLGREIKKMWRGIQYTTTMIINDPKSVRGVYLALKKQESEVQE